ncbi:MAG: HPr(Ser) kinase/phosphatase [Thermodesulfobacteriota bacterium]
MAHKNNQNLTVINFLDFCSEKLNIKPLSDNKVQNRKIISPTVQKPGLRIIEKEINLEKGKIQILGRTEIAYINKLNKPSQDKVLKSLSTQKVPCYIFSKGIKPGKNFLSYFKNSDIPLFISDISTGKLISEINEILGEKLAPMETFHGVLMDINRLGVLILGKSGIGKSECALDLINKGSKLIADDVIEIRRISQSRLVGSGPENIKYLMEIRGIGIVNIKDLFGTTSVMDKRNIDMVLELDHWNKDTEYERLGLETKSLNILGVELPHVIIPVSPGRNIATVIELAVRNQILKNSGLYSAIEIINN